MSLRSSVPGIAVALLLAACGASGVDTPAADAPAPAADEPTGEVVVFAAASLTEAFGAIAETVEAEHPRLEVVLNLAGSQQLAGQIVAGAPADVLATADPARMAVVADADLVAEPPRTFATNGLAIAVERGNPLGIGGLADLARDDVVLVLAAEEVPAGRYAADALDAAGVAVAPASRETDVRAVLSKVALGEADAGLVYRSDVAAADGAVDEVPIPARGDRDGPGQPSGAGDVVATYPIAVLADAPNPEGAAAFVGAVTSPAGRDVLEAHGFGAP